MSFPTVYYITQVIPSCYSAGYAMCVCVSFGACVYRSLGNMCVAGVTRVCVCLGNVCGGGRGLWVICVCVCLRIKDDYFN